MKKLKFTLRRLAVFNEGKSYFQIILKIISKLLYFVYFPDYLASTLIQQVVYFMNLTSKVPFNFKIYC